ncbi:MAG: hypothetical protein ACLQHK_02255, partial [Gallionellaceae bacterium]
MITMNLLAKVRRLYYRDRVALSNERDFPVPRLRRKPRTATSAMMESGHFINTAKGEVHEYYHR